MITALLSAFSQSVLQPFPKYWNFKISLISWSSFLIVINSSKNFFNIFSPFSCSAHFPTFFRNSYIYLNFLSQLVKKVGGQMGFEPANPHKYWVFSDQIGVLKVGRKWANGQKIDHFYPNSTNFHPYTPPISLKLLQKVGSQKQKWARNFQ